MIGDPFALNNYRTTTGISEHAGRCSGIEMEVVVAGGSVGGGLAAFSFAGIAGASVDVGVGGAVVVVVGTTRDRSVSGPVAFSSGLATLLSNSSEAFWFASAINRWEASADTTRLLSSKQSPMRAA